MKIWLKWPVLDICLGDVCVLDAHVRDSCVQDVCVRNALCPSAGCFTMRCHCLRLLCARCLSLLWVHFRGVCSICLSVECLSAGYISYMCIYILHVHSMTGWRFWVCSISVCLMPKFEMSVCRMSVINVCLGNDCEALISFLWWDLLSAMPLCGISVCEWLSSVCVSPGFLRWMNVYWITVWRMSQCWMPKFRMSACIMVC